MSRRLVDGKRPQPPEGANKGGAPTKLTQDIIDKIVQGVRIGAPVLTATALQGLSYETVRNWIILGVKSPDSLHGAFLQAVNTAVAQWEIGDIAVIHRHANGAPAEYMMEPVRDNKGNVVFTKDAKGNKVALQQPVRDGDGNPVLVKSEVRSDWRAAMERLSRRKPRHWQRREQLSINSDPDEVLKFDNTQVGTEEKKSFETEVAEAMVKFDDEY